MPKCRMCGGYASEGKSLCPFDQIRNGKLEKGKWIVDWNAGLKNRIGTGEIQYDSNGQMTFLDDGNGQTWDQDEELEQMENEHE